MLKAYFKKKFYKKDVELITDKTERFIVVTNDVKQGFGAWYSILALRIIPLLLFFVPLNVVLAHITLFISSRFAPDLDWDGPILLVAWGLAIAVLFLLTIIAPKIASVFEFCVGFAYLFLVFKNHLFNTALGVSLLICMILYLLVKIFFLVVNIMSIVKFSRDEKGVERDETGRIIQAVDEDVVFVKSDEDEKNESNNLSPDVYNDFLLEKTDENYEDASAARLAYDDDFFFDKIQSDESAIGTYNEEFFFVREEDNADTPVAGTDEDYFFG